MAQPYGFCGDTPLSPFFVEGNLTPCFLYLFTAALQAVYIVTFGTAQAARLYLLDKQTETPPLSRRPVLAATHVVSWTLVALPVTLLITTMTSGDPVQPYRTASLGILVGTWVAASVLLAADQLRTHRISLVMACFYPTAIIAMVLELYYQVKLAVSATETTPVDPLELAFASTQLALLVVLVALVYVSRLPPAPERKGYQRVSINDDPEPAAAVGEAGKKSGTKPTDAAAGANKVDISPWKGLRPKLEKLLPFLWPAKSQRLRIHVVVSFILLLSVRVLNIYVPIYQKIVVDDLAGDGPGGEVVFPWQDLLVYVLLRWLQGASGSMGVINNIRAYLWIPVEQYTRQEISVSTFAHMHQLSLRYHLHRKTGEVLRVIDRGTTSIQDLLTSVLFNILPALLDIGIGVVYFAIAFDIYLGIIVFVSMVGYMGVTIWITEWRTRFRRASNDADNDARQKAVDSLLNFETVKYYGAEEYEVKRFREAITKYNLADWMSQTSLIILNSTQNTIITAGLLAGSMLTAYRVSVGELTVGDFTLFLSYLMQLYSPLNWFGTYYRQIQQNFIDMEKLLDLLDQNVEIQDSPNAKELVVTRGELEFDNVTFQYDERVQSLKGISFKVPAGKTYALVGSSGGGKTTIMRLVFRFYDVRTGRILIDGQDIRDVTQRSLRRAIGVVPQDTVLFNDTIRYNIAYGNLDEADENAIIEAAKRAQIDEKIRGFPDGYNTMVGERGLRLSGGEKQRVAIARTLLKNPKIVLLDEATSALDTETERHIQASLAEMSKERTALTIAHRLSTIINADQILVLKDGEIIERGTHSQLLQIAGGEYANLWQRQQDALTKGSGDDAAVSSPSGKKKAS